MGVLGGRFLGRFVSWYLFRCEYLLGWLFLFLIICMRIWFWFFFFMWKDFVVWVGSWVLWGISIVIWCFFVLGDLLMMLRLCEFMLLMWIGDGWFVCEISIVLVCNVVFLLMFLLGESVWFGFLFDMCFNIFLIVGICEVLFMSRIWLMLF